ncbi:MAG: hypothetical protein KKH80_02530 [Candidatus Omnitrophica bacterium]|nr:hypothetical protein [Candidatus Omnitrophota bacterium]
MEIKKINLSPFISMIVLIVAALIGMKINTRQNNEIKELIHMQEEEFKKNSILNEAGKLNKKIDYYKSAFTQRDSRKILNTIIGLAQTEGVKIISLKPLERIGWDLREDEATYGRNLFELIIQVNDYAKLGHFISELEGGHTMISIESCRLAIFSSGTAGEITKPDKLRVDLTISEIFFKR